LGVKLPGDAFRRLDNRLSMKMVGTNELECAHDFNMAVLRCHAHDTEYYLA